MAQIVPFDALLGASKTGLAIGATIYELDGSTSYAAFSTTGWYEAPAGSGGWHHAGLSLPDAGGVVAVGIAATEYLRIAVDAASASAAALATIAGYIDTEVAAILAAVDTEVAAIKAKTDNLPTAPADASDVAAAITAATAPLATTTQLTTVAGYIDTEVASILAAVDTEVAAIKAKTDNLPAAPASTTNITAGTITTVTNLTNAPTSGDLTATMKTSVTTAATAATPTAAAVTGAVGSVTGDVGGNVVGSVASVTAPVTVGTNNDKTGYALSAAGVQAIWDALTSALTTVGSVGKRIADNLDATISSRMATFTYTTPPTVAAISDGVWDEATVGHTTAGTFGEQLKTDVDAILDDTGTAGVIVATGSKTGYELSATGVTAIWANATRTLTSFGTLAADVWAVAVRTITGGSLTVAPPTAAQIDTQLSGTHGAGAWSTATGFATPTNVSDAQTAIIAAIPGTTAIVDAIKAYAVETGVTFNDAMRIILAANGGNFLADDPNDPTEIIYYAPDGTTARLTFAVTTTTRTVV